MTLRALSLLGLDSEQAGPTAPFILDIGCGSGLSGEILTQEGYAWVGMDISADMLSVALEREVEGDIMLADIGAGIPFRPGTFDGAISISVLQWLLNADTRHNNPHARLTRFFQTLYSSLRTGGKACFQFYPESDAALDMIMGVVKRCGFGGGVVVDEPESKRQRKHYLVVQAGGQASLSLTNVTMAPEERRPAGGLKRKQDMSRKEYIQHKKEQFRKRGKMVKSDSKYSGRARKPKF